MCSNQDDGRCRFSSIAVSGTILRKEQGKARMKVFMLFLVVVGILIMASVAVMAVIETSGVEKDKGDSC